MHKVFIDGQYGTTGLQIERRLRHRDDIKLLSISTTESKDPRVKRDMIAIADVVVLCLPDDAARATVQLTENTAARLLDASTAHRTHQDWVYGLPELEPSQRVSIKQAIRVANPGCYPTGFLLALMPLVKADIAKQDVQFSIHAISGYSGGGHQLIARYQAKAANTSSLWHCRPYALQFGHKHLPEMQYYAGLNLPPLFTPVVGHYYQGMLVSVPLSRTHLSGPVDLPKVHACLSDFYASEPCVKVHMPNDPVLLTDGFLDPEGNNHTNRNDIFIFGNHEQIQLISRLDNLGKGAAGAAVQNLNLMLGAKELNGLQV